MNTSQVESSDCKVKVRKYVLVSQPSRWQQKRRERVVVQSPILNITKDVSFVPVRVLNGLEHNLVCYIPRTDIERDSSDTYARQHVSYTPSYIEAHGTAIRDNDPSDDFLYLQTDRFWININSSTVPHKDKVPVINLRTFQSGEIPTDHVCWFPRIHTTIWCPNTKARCEQLWTPGGPVRKLKLCGPGNYTLFSFVICQFMNGAKSIAKDVVIPAKDTQSHESRYLSLPESTSYFIDRRRGMTTAELDGNSLSQPLEILLPTPPASPELIIVKVPGKGKGKAKVPLPTPPAPTPPDESNSIWMRIKDMADRRPYPNGQYVLKNSPIHPRTSQVVENSTQRGRPSSMSIPPNDYDSDSYSSLDSMSSYSRDVSPAGVDADKLRKDVEGQRVNGGIILKELHKIRPNDDLGERSYGLAFSAADPSIAKDPTRISAEWEANKPGHNPNLDNLCQKNDADCPYITKSTCKHYHPDPSKCQLNKQARLELHDPEPANLSREWRAWAQANRSNTQDRHVDHEHCISRLRPYPAGAGDCMLAGNPLQNHVCCLWDPQDLDGLPQNFTRAYTKSKVADAERHRVTIFDQSNLVRTENRLEDIGFVDESLCWGGKTLQKDLADGRLGEELEFLEMDMDGETIDVGEGSQVLGQITWDFGEEML